MSAGAAGTLYVVATPIGNLGDLSPRAREVLGEVALIAAEDTRHAGRLLKAFGIRGRMMALHEHNEHKQADRVLAALRGGDNVALVSDAGTPGISDPGFRLVKAALEADLRVSPIPGPAAFMAALSVSGQPTDRFVFEGFLPSRSAARRRHLRALASEPRTLVFHEACHRIVASLGDMVELFGADRSATIGRELTKLHETVRRGTLATLHEWVQTDADQQRGELVVIVAGTDQSESTADASRVLDILLHDLPPARAAALAARITGESKRALYARALEAAGEKPQGN